MLIEEYRGHLPVRRMCELMNVSRSAYYNFKNKDWPNKDLKDLALKEEIEKVALFHSGYGSRRITYELRKRGKLINHKKVLRLMRELRLTKKKKHRKPNENLTHNLPVYPNLIKDFLPSDINQLWVADITYIRLRYGFCFLSAILDAFSRRVVGWALRDNLSAELALSALRMALIRRVIGPRLIHHSDQGVQYASKEYVNLLKSHGILISMSTKGCPQENAMAESFISTIKKEEVYLSEYDNITEALNCMGHFIEDLYNRKRLHSSIGYLSPVEFEDRLGNELYIENVS
ncbi:MAG: IS3 family transposase [Acidobacteriota bacterium]